MRLFFIGWSVMFPELADVVLKIKSRNHQILYWSGANLNLVDKSNFSGTIFHDHFDALANKPASGIDDSNFLPPERDLIRELYEAESIVLTMMNKKYWRLSITERKHFYYHLIQYWRGVIQKLKPDAIVFMSVPHTVYDFVIYSLAKVFKIKTIMFQLTWVCDRYFVLNDYKESSPYIKQAIQANNKNFDLKEISMDLQEHYNNQNNPKIDSTPVWINDYVDIYSGTNKVVIKIKMILKSIKDFSIFSKTLKYFCKQFNSNLKKEYEMVQKDPDFDKKFIYAPLHFQPECTTSPIGDIFVDQVLMIEILSAVIPIDWLIYVKEHPTQWLPTGLSYFNYKYKNYYKHIAELKNVRIVPVKTNSFLLINKAQAVATVTGTTAWEAVLRSKPALIFGYQWFQYMSGVFRISDAASCRAAIYQILNGFKVDKQQVINYLAIFDKFSFHGYDDMWVKKVTSINAQENCDNFTRAIISEIEK